jgi:hypothetical protein
MNNSENVIFDGVESTNTCIEIGEKIMPKVFIFTHYCRWGRMQKLLWGCHFPQLNTAAFVQLQVNLIEEKRTFLVNELY